MKKQDQARYEDEAPQKKIKLNQQEDNDDIDEEQLKQALIDADEIEDAFNDGPTLEQFLLQLEKHIKLNQDQRAKYPTLPEKFVDSEVELEYDIRGLSTLSAYPELFTVFARSSQLQEIIMLLQHPNTDVTNDVVNFFEDLVSTVVEENHANALLKLYDSLVKKLFFEVVVDCIHRFNEEDSEESDCVHKCLSIIENMIEIRISYCKELCDRTKLLQWLLNRITTQSLKGGKLIDDNKLYASEILVQLLQSSIENQYQIGKIGGIDKLLVGISHFMTSQTEAAEDKETLENLFHSLSLILLLKENQNVFFECEGIQLMIKFVSNKGQGSVQALKILSIAMDDCPEACRAFIDYKGLSLIFPILIQKGIKNKNPKIQKEIDSSILIIMKYLLQQCKENYLERLIYKFHEPVFVQRLLQLRNQYSSLLKKQQQLDESIYLEELDQGRLVVENCDIILLELLNQSDQKVEQYIVENLKSEGISILTLVFTVGIMLEFVKQGSKPQIYYEQLIDKTTLLIKEQQKRQQEGIVKKEEEN